MFNWWSEGKYTPPPASWIRSSWATDTTTPLSVWKSRARRVQRFLSQPFFVAEQFTGSKGKYVKVEDNIKGFDRIVAGELDHLPESAFYMVGTIEEAIEKGQKLLAEG